MLTVTVFPLMGAGDVVLAFSGDPAGGVVAEVCAGGGGVLVVAPPALGFSVELHATRRQRLVAMNLMVLERRKACAGLVFGPQLLERRAQFVREDGRLLPRGEVRADLRPVVIDQVRV